MNEEEPLNECVSVGDWLYIYVSFCVFVRICLVSSVRLIGDCKLINELNTTVL